MISLDISFYFNATYILICWQWPKKYHRKGLTPPPLVPHICVSESGLHWFRSSLVAYSPTSDYPNQWWVIVKLTLGNNIASENIVVKWRPFSSGGDELTHWDRNKMDVVSQTTLSKYFFLNEKFWISIKSSLKFVPKGPINNTPALVQMMDWRRPGDKPLSEPIKVKLPTRRSASVS